MSLSNTEKHVKDIHPKTRRWVHGPNN